MGGWWGRRLATDLVADLTDGWLVGGVVSNGFGSGFNGWVVGGGRLATDLVADLTDGWLVGGVVSNGFGSGFNGWVVGGGGG
ncbi:MAG: hypothetical protein U7126_13010 [Microcoleus sp.]